MPGALKQIGTETNPELLKAGHSWLFTS